MACYRLRMKSEQPSSPGDFDSRAAEMAPSASLNESWVGVAPGTDPVGRLKTLRRRHRGGDQRPDRGVPDPPTMPRIRLPRGPPVPHPNPSSSPGPTPTLQDRPAMKTRRTMTQPLVGGPDRPSEEVAVSSEEGDSLDSPVHWKLLMFGVLFWGSMRRPLTMTMVVFYHGSVYQ